MASFAVSITLHIRCTALLGKCRFFLQNLWWPKRDITNWHITPLKICLHLLISIKISNFPLFPPCLIVYSAIVCLNITFTYFHIDISQILHIYILAFPQLLQICKFTHLHLNIFANLQLYEISKFTNLQIIKFWNLQIYKFVNLKFFKFTNLQICKSSTNYFLITGVLASYCSK